jgi:hypothetical protein
MGVAAAVYNEGFRHRLGLWMTCSLACDDDQMVVR